MAATQPKSFSEGRCLQKRPPNVSEVAGHLTGRQSTSIDPNPSVQALLLLPTGRSTATWVGSEHLERPWEWKCPETVSLPKWFPFGHERCLLGRWWQNTHVISANSAPLDRETLCFCSAWGTVINLPNHWLLWPLHWDSKADPSLGCCPPSQCYPIFPFSMLQRGSLGWCREVYFDLHPLIWPGKQGFPHQPDSTRLVIVTLHCLLQATTWQGIFKDSGSLIISVFFCKMNVNVLNPPFPSSVLGSTNSPVVMWGRDGKKWGAFRWMKSAPLYVPDHVLTVSISLSLLIYSASSNAYLSKGVSRLLVGVSPSCLLAAFPVPW